ncbi:MAG: carboxypeptidase-like regulatory domain-containing protein [Candidatus Odinarchaeota archaeon]
MNDFSIEDYNATATLSEEKYSLGSITIKNIDFSQLDPGYFIFNTTYPQLYEDYNSKSLNYTDYALNFMETIDSAIVDNIDSSIIDNDKIIVKLNESISFEYNNLTEGYLIYHPRLDPCELLQLFVNNGSDIFELEDETNYTIDNDGFIKFKYVEYFQEWPNTNFSMYFIWKYSLNIVDWSITQISKKNLEILHLEQNFTIDFNYKFKLNSYKYNESSEFPDDSILAQNIDIALTANPPDKNLLSNHTLELNNETVDIGEHLMADNSVDVYLTDDFTGENSSFSLYFKTQFGLKFIEPVGETWAIDRLIGEQDIRERIYLPSLISGPQKIYLKNISFYEPAIYINQIIRNYTLFERSFTPFSLNKTLTGREGIKVKIPYLILGETCPSIIEYKPTQTLRIVVTDSIKMPLIGAEVKVFYYGKEYGTYISRNWTQPIALGKTNENGEVSLKYVPAGNYTIKVYKSGLLLKESTCKTINSINYVNTSYPHFPIWIIIFGTLNGIILILGVIFYLKYKKTR